MQKNKVQLFCKTFEMAANEQMDFVRFLKRGGGQTKQIVAWLRKLDFYRCQGIKSRYNLYTIVARCLRQRRNPYKTKQKFNFPLKLKLYLRFLTGGEIVGTADRKDAIDISAKDIVKWVIPFWDGNL